jgi:hypothetical protein
MTWHQAKFTNKELVTDVNPDPDFKIFLQKTFWPYESIQYQSELK